MARLRLRISMSLDGFVAGPSQSLENPIGMGGMRLHEWVFPLRAWRAMQGMPGGEVNESNRVVEESIVTLKKLGAVIVDSVSLPDYVLKAQTEISEGANKSWCSPTGARPVRVRP